MLQGECANCGRSGWLNEKHQCPACIKKISPKEDRKMSVEVRLEDIKQCDIVDAITALAKGRPVDSKVIINDAKWLIEQAEKAERYEKILKEIVGYTKYKGNNWYEKAEKALKE